MAEQGGAAGGGGFFKRQIGPLPMWAWMALAVGALLVVAMWQQNKGGAADSDVSYTEVPEGSALPTYVFQNYDYDFTTINDAPPGGGRPTPVPGPPVPGPSPTPVPGTPPRTPPVNTGPKPPPPAAPAPVPKPPPGRWVTVAKYTSKNPPWNSTVWGISQHYGIKSWQTVWNHPNNANLRGKRKKPEGIQPGDKVWVPG